MLLRSGVASRSGPARDNPGAKARGGSSSNSEACAPMFGRRFERLHLARASHEAGATSTSNIDMTPCGMHSSGEAAVARTLINTHPDRMSIKLHAVGPKFHHPSFRLQMRAPGSELDGPLPGAYLSEEAGARSPEQVRRSCS